VLRPKERDPIAHGGEGAAHAQHAAVLIGAERDAASGVVGAHERGRQRIALIDAPDGQFDVNGGLEFFHRLQFTDEDH
jgi:hypothetical protein